MSWKRGVTLMTPTTKRWSKEQIEKNDNIEQTMIFSNFSATDLGIGRELVCTLNRSNTDYEKNAKLIEAAPYLCNALNELVERTEELATIVHLITKEQGLAITNAREAIKRATL